MTEIALAKASYSRSLAREPVVLTRNRYFEANPALTTQSQMAMIARPALRRFIYVGDGPIRATYSQPGSFDDAAFVVSFEDFYRVDRNSAVTFIIGGLAGGATGRVSMAATANIGATPEYLFFCDGRVLYVYLADGFAQNELLGSPANTDTVVVDVMHYAWTNGSVDAGAPDGTGANPWLVALGASDLDAFTNLKAAFADSGTAGTQYSTALTPNTLITPLQVFPHALKVRAATPGVLGNSIVATETGAALAWSDAGGFMVGGGDPSVTAVDMPDDVGVISVGYIGSYVIVVPAQGEGKNGLFYWIDPGDTTVDPLNFATAERSPDPVFEVVVFGDQFWLPGQSTTEVWYLSGDIAAPVVRLQGVTFDRGTWEGTAIQVKDSMIITDSDGAVWQIQGQPVRVSTPDIEQRIRMGIQKQAALTP